MQMGNAVRLALLITNTDRSDFAAGHPDDAAKFGSLVSGVRPGWEMVAHDVTLSEFPEDLSAFQGIIIGGSPASVHDDRPWIAPLLSLIRAALAREVPLFGACFGHQAIALALGGAVGANPGGWSLGSVPTEVVRPQPWIPGEAATIRLHAAHKEQVTRLPDGAGAWGRTPGCPAAGFVIGGHVFTTQYHPEITAGFMAALLDEMAAQDAAPAQDLDRGRQSLAAPAENARFAEWIAGFFERAEGGSSGRVQSNASRTGT